MFKDKNFEQDILFVYKIITMDLTEILITVITVAGSTGIWQFISTRYKAKMEEQKFDKINSDGMQYRDDLKARVRNMESLLAQSSEEKDQMRQQVLALTAEVHALRVKVEFLEKENERLSEFIGQPLSELKIQMGKPDKEERSNKD